MDVTLTKIQRQAAAQAVRVTQHAQIEMDAEEIPWMKFLRPSLTVKFWKITLSTDVANVAYSMVVHPKDVIYILSALQHNQR